MRAYPPSGRTRYLFVTEQPPLRPSGRGQPSLSRALPRLLLAALGVFVLALLLVTGAELVIGHPLSGGQPGETTMSALFVTAPGPVSSR